MSSDPVLSSADVGSSSRPLPSNYFSSNCREELEGHVSCVKLFLEEHVKYGTPYSPGTNSDDDHCRLTRQLYMKCMSYRKRHPVTPQTAAAAETRSRGPKPCNMELAMHGNCVARQLERTQKMGEKYWTQGGEDRCSNTRSNYQQCMYRLESGAVDKYNLGSDFTRELESNVSHIHVFLDNK